MHVAVLWLTTVLATALVKGWSWTWRKDTSALAELDAHVAANRPVLVLCWHGKYLPLFALAQGRDVVAMTSVSDRGAVIAGICRAFGYRPALVGGGAGHSTRSVLEAALEQRPALAATAADGPLGPQHRVKPGLVRLAFELGYGLMPVTARASRKLILWRRWDRMEVPLPFARVSVVTAPLIQLPKQLDGEALAEAIQKVESAFDLLLED